MMESDFKATELLDGLSLITLGTESMAEGEPRVPMELLVQILGHVGERDSESRSMSKRDKLKVANSRLQAKSRLQTLAACCLVSRTFLAPARAELWRTLDLVADLHNSEGKKQIDALCMFHHLSNFIRSITLTCTSSHSSADDLLWHALHNAHSPSEINFQIQGDSDELDRIHQILLDSCSPSSLLALSIEIRYYGRDGGRTRVTMALDEIFRKQPKLKRLTFATNDVSIYSDRPAFELTHLHLELPRLERRVFRSLTESSRETLTHLSIEIAEGSDVPNLSLLPRLQHLQVSWTDNFADPCPFLTRISSIPLESFVLITTSIFSDDDDPKDDAAETPDVLSLLGPALRIVTLPLPPAANLKAFLFDTEKCPDLVWMEFEIGDGRRWQDGQWLPSDLAFAVSAAGAKRGLELRGRADGGSERWALMRIGDTWRASAGVGIEF